VGTRFYFDSAAAAEVSPAYDLGWNYSAEASRYRLNLGKKSSAMATGARIGPWTPDSTALDRQFVSKPLDAGVVFTSGGSAVKGRMRGAEFAVSDNAYPAWKIFVANRAGTKQAYLYDGSSSLEFSTALTNRNPFAAGGGLCLANYTTAQGDRLVVEVGYMDVSGTTPEANSRFGDAAASDLPEDESSTNDYNPWVEFPQAITEEVVGAAPPPFVMRYPEPDPPAPLLSQRAAFFGPKWNQVPPPAVLAVAVVVLPGAEEAPTLLGLSPVFYGPNFPPPPPASPVIAPHVFLPPWADPEEAARIAPFVFPVMRRPAAAPGPASPVLAVAVARVLIDDDALDFLPEAFERGFVGPVWFPIKWADYPNAAGQKTYLYIDPAWFSPAATWTFETVMRASAADLWAYARLLDPDGYQVGPVLASLGSTLTRVVSPPLSLPRAGLYTVQGGKTFQGINYVYLMRASLRAVVSS
jgi:hypothetical protein